jgi:hypothetical protein
MFAEVKDGESRERKPHTDTHAFTWRIPDCDVSVTVSSQNCYPTYYFLSPLSLFLSLWGELGVDGKNSYSGC